MKPRISHLVPGIVLMVAFGLVACGGESKTQQTQDQAAGAAQTDHGAPPAFGIGLPAPDFTLKDIHGQDVSLSAQRGKAVIVDFWATWCGPCRVAMPHLQALSQDYPEQLVVLAVSLDQNPLQVVPPFAKQMGLTFPLLADPAAAQVARQWGGVSSIPTAFLIDPQGNVVLRWVGAHKREVYEAEVRKVLGLGV